MFAQSAVFSPAHGTQVTGLQDGLQRYFTVPLLPESVSQASAQDFVKVEGIVLGDPDFGGGPGAIGAPETQDEAPADGQTNIGLGLILLLALGAVAVWRLV